MSPQHPAPGSNAAAAAAPDEQESGPPGRSSPAPAESRSQATAPEANAEPGTPQTAEPEPGATPTAEPEPGGTPTAEPEPEPGGTPAGATAATPSRTTAGPVGAPEPETGVARAAGAAPQTRTGTGVDGGRPRAPMLAGAAFLGAVLIAVPLLLVGSANDDRHGPSGQGPAAGSADTVLGPGAGPGALGDYVAGTADPTPDKEKPERTAAPKATVPAPVAPAPEPEPKASSRAPSKKPEPKAAPKPDWTTVTVSAPSVLEVDQAWTTNRIRMVMQPDGNLVVLNEESKPIWASMTFGENHRAIFQPDGNLVIHNGDDRPIWASRTHDHPGARLVLRADAKVAVVDGGRVIWST